MKRKTKRILTIMCAIMLVFGMAVPAGAAGTRNLKDYYYVQVAMEISATMVQAKSASAGGTIEDWGQAVFAGSDVSASLVRRSNVPNDSVAKPAVTYNWRLVKESQTKVITNKSLITIPAEFAGGYIEVTATTAGDRNNWAASSVTSHVTIS